MVSFSKIKIKNKLKLNGFLIILFLAMAVLLYRLEIYDLFLFWILTFSLILLLSRLVVLSFLASLIAVIVFFILYSYLALPPVDQQRHNKFISSLKVGAHRGLALDAPENTLAAFRLSKKMRADAIEFDLEFTKDGMPVILHDDTVDRTTDGQGRIDEIDWERVQKLNAGAKFVGAKSDFEKIPTLEETVELGRKLGFKMFIDVKRPHELVVPTITKLFRKYPDLYNTTAVCSFFPQVAYQVKSADPNIITGHTWRPFFFSHADLERTEPRYAEWYKRMGAEIFQNIYFWSLQNWLWKWTGINLVLAHHESVTKAYVDSWSERNIQVVAWTVNDLSAKRFYLNSLKCPFLTDQLSDAQADLKGADVIPQDMQNAPPAANDL